jgi:tRNA nucleotidyltransferase/poly(A) polymerase
MEIITFLNSRGFIKSLQETGEVYLVGGIVRDSFLEKESKDIDLLVTGIPIDELISLIEPFGKVDFVGKSFGVLKFRPNGLASEIEDIDIAIPRTERKIGTGHQGFEITADHNLKLEDDLFRRDFTFNAMAINLRDSKVIDPFQGIQSILNKEIKIVNPVAFGDDPLRMMRAIQFASRFGFKIELETFGLINRNAPMIKEISGERILTELDKIFEKGDHVVGFDLLENSGLFEQIFGFYSKSEGWFQMKNRFDFYFKLLEGSKDRIKSFNEILKGDVQTSRNLECLEMIPSTILEPWESRMIAFKMFKKSKESLFTELAPEAFNRHILELLEGKFPTNLSLLEINGEDLLRLGFKGRSIGETLDKIIERIMQEKLTNDRALLLEFAAECLEPQES